MFRVEKYIENGRISRGKIAIDIKYGDLDQNDIDDIIACDEVKKCFFNEGQTKKIDKSQWNDDYLNILSYAAIAEVFDAEYLHYLCDVAEYVNSKKREKSHLGRKCSIGVFVILIVGLVYVVLRD